MHQENQSLLYFSYGEHMNEAEMLRDFPHARCVGYSRLEGFQLCFVGRDGMARAAIEARPRGQVPGRVWSLYDEDAGALDRIADAPHFARGEIRMVAVGGMNVPALVYITVPGQQQGRPGFITYDLMREAYEETGHDVDVLRQLAMQSTP